MGADFPPEPSPLRADPHPPRIYMPANLLEKKGHHILLAALEGLELPPGTGVILAGAGPLRETIRRRIEQAGLGNTVKLVGLMAHQDLMNTYRRGEADLVVLPSIITADGQKEGIPNTLIEAMAWGIPSIGTDTGGTAELLDHTRGWLLKPGDVEGLRRALAEALADVPGRLERGARGRAWVEEHFNLERNAAWLSARFAADSPTAATLGR
jgi:colanic acid/amylovoran biosynthesis glycosyltransferase